MYITHLEWSVLCTRTILVANEVTAANEASIWFHIESEVKQGLVLSHLHIGHFICVESSGYKNRFENYNYYE